MPGCLSSSPSWYSSNATFFLACRPPPLPWQEQPLPHRNTGTNPCHRLRSYLSRSDSTLTM
ncbi:hypothetical protein E2562_030889 [Oryza meyeriana var. granulata]|uniref:Uncharacterized protein n=1 Tax=Oryza meyeriana var. granulata TaxID=110450 RepID=A0A6G1F082_9ORYZ|nr:hypothetical protein E2562_030889 [Oryza meyeriana var. granulata]